VNFFLHEGAEEDIAGRTRALQGASWIASCEADDQAPTCVPVALVPLFRRLRSRVCRHSGLGCQASASEAWVRRYAAMTPKPSIDTLWSRATAAPDCS